MIQDVPSPHCWGQLTEPHGLKLGREEGDIKVISSEEGKRMLDNPNQPVPAILGFSGLPSRQEREWFLHPGVEIAPIWESASQVQVPVVLLPGHVTWLKHVFFCPFGLSFSICTMGGGMDSPLMF